MRPLHALRPLSVVARKAWKKAPFGESEISILFDTRRVVKDRKLVLVMPTDQAVRQGKCTAHADAPANELHIVAFPKPEDMPVFELISSGVERGGPADWYPGAVGTVGLSILAKKEGGVEELVKEVRRQIPELSASAMKLAFAQAHFRTGGVQGLPRGIATKYGGWRRRCLREAILLAGRHSCDIIVDKKAFPRFFEGGKYTRPTFFEKELSETTRELKAKVFESNRYLVIRPPVP